MKKLFSGYLFLTLLLALFMHATNLSASVTKTDVPETGIGNTKNNTASVDSVIVNDLNVKSGNLVKLVKPIDNTELGLFLANSIMYPPSAVAQDLEGSVRVLISVKRNGSVSRAIAIESSNEILAREVVKAAKNIRFQPIVQNGFPVNYELILPVRFELIR